MDISCTIFDISRYSMYPDIQYIMIFDISIQLNQYRYCITGLMYVSQYGDISIYCYISTRYIYMVMQLALQALTRYIYMVECSQLANQLALQAQIIVKHLMLVVRHLLTIMFIQRSSCIGRLQVEHVDILIYKNQILQLF